MASAERKAITGVWEQSPQRGPGAEPLVRGSGGEAPLKLKALSFTNANGARICQFLLPCKLLKYAFWATVCKTVRPMLLDRCLSVCPVCPVCVGDSNTQRIYKWRRRYIYHVTRNTKSCFHWQRGGGIFRLKPVTVLISLDYFVQRQSQRIPDCIHATLCVCE